MYGCKSGKYNIHFTKSRQRSGSFRFGYRAIYQTFSYNMIVCVCVCVCEN